MSNNYVDKWGRLHHKPCIDEEPSSGNGWIYTAYAHKLGLTLFMEGLASVFNQCLNVAGKFYWRSPGKALPPLSRDEVLGAVSLGFLKPHHLNGWNFSPFPLPKFSLIKLLSQLWQLRPDRVRREPFIIGRLPEYRHTWVPKHRNYFWQNNLDQLYRFAFSVPLTDRYFCLKTWDTFCWYKPSHLCYYIIAKVDSFLGKKNGIRFLKYAYMGTPDARSKDLMLAMAEEFPKDHPISEAVKNGFSA